MAKYSPTYDNVAKAWTLEPSGEALAREERMASMGIFVGTVAPDLVPYADWILNGTGYWAWIDISSADTGVVNVAVNVGSGVGGGSGTAIEALSATHVAEIVKAAEGSAYGTPSVATVVNGIGVAVGSGVGEAFGVPSTAAASQFVATLVGSASGGASGTPSIAEIAGLVLTAVGSGAGTGSGTASTANAVQFVAATVAVGASAGVGTPSVATSAAMVSAATGSAVAEGNASASVATAIQAAAVNTTTGSATAGGNATAAVAAAIRFIAETVGMATAGGSGVAAGASVIRFESNIVGSAAAAGSATASVATVAAGETATIYASAGDGTVTNYDDQAGGVWSPVRSAASGSSVETSGTLGYIEASTSEVSTTFARAFIPFDLTSLAGKTVNSAVLYFTADADNSYTPVIHVQQGTQAIPLTVNDYDNFIGSSFGSVSTGGTSGEKSIVLGSGGVSYLQSVVGSTAKLCLREAADYNGVTPYEACWLQIRLSEYGGTTRPRLVIEYT